MITASSHDVQFGHNAVNHSAPFLMIDLRDILQPRAVMVYMHIWQKIYKHLHNSCGTLSLKLAVAEVTPGLQLNIYAGLCYQLRWRGSS